MGRTAIPVPLLPRPVRWTAVRASGAFVFYASLVTVPETVVDDTQPELVPINSWRHLMASLALAGSLAYATDDWDLDR